MQVIGCLSWFNEPPSWLAGTVASMGKLCSHIVAFDGAYGMFPDQKAASSPLQADAIMRTADGLGLGCTIHRPMEKWWAGEVDKRSKMLQVASTFTYGPEDWILVQDADEILVEAWSGTRTQLTETDKDVAEITFTDAWGGRFGIRRLFRALPGLRVEYTHYTVVAEKDGRKVCLNGDEKHYTIEEALRLPDVRLLDRSDERDAERRAAKQHYYAIAIPMEQQALLNGGMADAEVG